MDQVHGSDSLSGAAPGASLEGLPLSFIPNRGQRDKNALFYAKTPQYTLWIAGDEMVFDSIHDFTGSSLSGLEDGREPPMERMVTRVKFQGANTDSEAVPLGETAYRISCYFGRDPGRWLPNIPTFSSVLLKDIYPEVDLKIYGRDNNVEYDWIVRPGGRVSDIRISVIGAEGTEIDASGDLVVHTRFGDIRHKRPRSRQETGDKSLAVESRFVGLGGDSYGFDVDDYEPYYDLVIDPLVNLQSTYLGGSSQDYGAAVAAGPDGCVLMAGYTYSTDFPLQEALLTYKAGYDMFFTKFSPSGQSLEFSTYLGGSGHERCYDLAVDDEGNIYLAGYTTSQDFPVPSAAQIGIQGQSPLDTVLGADCQVVKIGADNQLKWTKSLGGSGDDYARNIHVIPKAPAPSVMMVGDTTSQDFPHTPDAYQPGNAGGTDGIIYRLDGASGTTEYATYFGGSKLDFCEEMQVETIPSGPSGGDVINIVTGRTTSIDFPTSSNALQKNNAGGEDAFLALFSEDWSTLNYSSYLGGSADDTAKSICVDPLGNIYVAGTTASVDFPTVDPYQANNAGYDDMFLSKFTADGTGLLFSSFLGGTDYDAARRIRLDKFGKIYLAGDTHSIDFPTKNPLYSDTDGELVDTVLTVFKKSLELYYSTYIGGTQADSCEDLFIDPGGGFALISGTTLSTDFPLKNASQVHRGGRDAFYMKITDAIVKSLVMCGDTGIFQKDDQSSSWRKIASAASAGCSGDLDGDGQGDLIGNWPDQGGVWVRGSAAGLWSYLASPTDCLTAGDMNGDGRDDLAGSWPGQGTFYRDSATGDWIRMAASADHVSAGDLDGDGRDDLIGNWPAQGGMWAKLSLSLTWRWLASPPSGLWAGDMNGDGRKDIVGSWDGQGVYCLDFVQSLWLKMASPAACIAAGERDGDGKDDLIGIWPGDNKVWEKQSTTGGWICTAPPADEHAVSCFTIMPGNPYSEAPPLAGRGTASEGRSLSSLHYRGRTPENVRRTGTFLDLSHLGPGGAQFVFSEERNEGPPRFGKETQRIPGPGDPGFRCREEPNLFPGGRKR
jgi:hypothetical protein